MKNLAVVVLATTLGLAAVACNPYDPSLGDRPFLCGSDEPRCPDGYEPVEESATSCSCQRAGGPSVDAILTDSAPFECNVDANESGAGNDSVSTPTDTGLGGSTTTFASDPLAICESGDVDVFSLDAESGQTITARVLYGDAQGDLSIEILADDASELATGNPISGGMEAAVEVTNTERHLVRVRAEVGVTNNYTLSIELTTP